MEEAHRAYRRHRDEGGDSDGEPKAAFQDAVMTFYELLRPYIKHESELEAYWNGKIPPYPDGAHSSMQAAKRYYEDGGVGVYQIQEHVEHVQPQQQVLADGGSDLPQTPMQWHRTLQRPQTSRIVSVASRDDGFYLREFRFAVLGLRELDGWRAKIRTERSKGDGFMAGQTRTKQRREYEPAMKITQAKRMLTEAANELGALPEYGIEDARDAEFEYSDLLENGQ